MLPQHAVGGGGGLHKLKKEGRSTKRCVYQNHCLQKLLQSILKNNDQEILMLFKQFESFAKHKNNHCYFSPFDVYSLTSFFKVYVSIRHFGIIMIDHSYTEKKKFLCDWINKININLIKHLCCVLVKFFYRLFKLSDQNFGLADTRLIMK